MPDSSRRNYSQPTRAMLWAYSGGVCCFPECDVSCVDETESGNTITIGQIAHIEAESDNGPRANPSLSDQERNAFPNLIVLCPTHHRIVDTDENTYTVEKMREWKAHRARVVRAAASRQGSESTDSSGLEEAHHSVSGFVLNYEEREASLHRETRDVIVGTAILRDCEAAFTDCQSRRYGCAFTGESSDRIGPSVHCLVGKN